MLPDVATTRQQLPASMPVNLGNMDLSFSEAELSQVPSGLPSGCSPGPDGPALRDAARR